MATTTQPYPSTALKSALPRQNLSAPSYNLATVATGQTGRHLVNEAGRLENCVVNLAVAGSAGSTVAQFRLLPRATGVAGNIGSAFTIDNAVTDPTTLVIPFGTGIDVEAGDILELNVTTAPTGGAHLCWTPNISRKFTV